MITADTLFLEGLQAHHQGQFNEALALYQQALSIDPQHAEALHLSGVIFALNGALTQAIESIQKSLFLNSENPLALNNLGKIFRTAGLLHSAIESFDKALHVDPQFVQAQLNLGKALSSTGQHYAAISNFAQAIQVDPHLTESHLLLASTLAALHQFDAATQHLQSIAGQHPAITVQAHITELQEQGYLYKQRIQKVVSKHQVNLYLEAGLKLLDTQTLLSIEVFDAALTLEPRHSKAYFCKGNAHIKLMQTYAAIECYDRAIASDPSNLDAIFNCGSALFSLKKYADSQIQFECVLETSPNDKNALFYLALSLKEQFQHQPAIEKFHQLHHIDPDYPLLLGHLITSKMSICDWVGLAALRQELAAKINLGLPVTPPFSTLSLLDSISLQGQAGQIYLDTQIKFEKATLPAPLQKHTKIKIGYFSTDFRNHAVAILTAQLYELHDRERFEVIAFSIGPDVRDEMNARLRKAFDQFIDANDWTDFDIVWKARELEIDIAIDLAGYTSQSKPGIFAQRVAPVQINWLGYPGPMGHPEMDYIIADPQVIPLKLRHAYSEKVIDLPCFQVNDQTRKISEKVFTKQALGIPDHHFVYCSLNANAKFTPEIFKAWMQILAQVPHSTLLLYAENDEVKSNLIHAAHSHSISPERLVFAEWMEPADNLARFKTADLFLDTSPFNAGTTASDALWAGLPVLTCAGEAFASRMAASLLHAVDLPELVTYSLSDYITKAVALAQSAEGTIEFKKHLSATRDSCVLFDTPAFVARLEAALIEICGGMDTRSSRV